MPSWLQGLRDALRALDRSPGREWQARLAHHGYRAVLVVAVAVILPWLFPRDTLPEFDGFEEGAVAERDVIARVPFAVYKSEAQLEAERREAEAGVASRFNLDPAAADTSVARVSEFLARVDSAVQASAADGERASDEAAEAVERAAVQDVLERAGLRATPEQLALLADADRRAGLRRALLDAFSGPLADGVVPAADVDEMASTSVILHGPSGDVVIPRDSLVTVGEFYQRAIQGTRGLGPTELQLFQPLLVRFLEPTVELDTDATLRARQQARSAVEASAGSVLEGERIITAHERIGRTEMDRLSAYQDKLVEEGLAGGPVALLRNLGSVLFGSILLGLLALVLYFFRPELYREVRSYSLVMFLVLLVVGVAGVVAGTGASPALIPIAFSALLLGALFDGVLALLAVMVTAGLLLGQPTLDPVHAPFLAMAAGGAAALGIREVRRRSQSWVLIAAIAGAYVLGGAALVLMGQLDAVELLTTAGWGTVNATLSTALAVGAALPALEAFTGRTSDQTLLELADLNRPLLRRLSREAPGTYAHSINVANLAEAACTAIGAHALRVRVGCYYHDIGKMERPQYFIENQPPGFNPHDRLRPSRSAEVIRDHVRDGLRLAEEARLPEVIKDFIREHHGTQKISFFFEKAREEEPELELNPGDFCYPGPKPQTKETAVVMLADAVESASRTLGDPTPERIRALIERLVEQRIDEDQLHQCLLTFRELDLVKSEFSRVLNGVYHRRIDYPPESREGGGKAPPAAAVPSAGSAGVAAIPPDTGVVPSGPWPRTPRRAGDGAAGEGDGTAEPEPEGPSDGRAGPPWIRGPEESRRSAG